MAIDGGRLTSVPYCGTSFDGDRVLLKFMIAGRFVEWEEETFFGYPKSKLTGNNHKILFLF